MAHITNINAGRSRRKNRAVKAAIISLCVFALAAIVLVIPTIVIAADGDGGTHSVFSLGAGSRGISLGRAYSTLADDASALYWNPAALRNVQSKQISFMYMPLYGDFTGATYTYLGGVYPTLNAGSFGVALMRVGSTFDMYDEFSRPLGEGDYSESQILIGYAFERDYRWLAGRLATGANFKIVNQKVDPYSSTAPGVDLGFRWIPNFAKDFAVGLNFQDLVGADHKLNTESDQTDRTTMLGLGYTRPFDNGSVLRVMLQMDMPARADSRFMAGIEYEFAEYISLRVGLDDASFSFGLGVVARGFGLDYAFLNRDTAGSSHPVTFSAQWGNSLDEQRAILAEQRAREDEEMIQRAFLARVQSHRDAAYQFEGEQNLPGAMDEWKIVLEFIPGDEEATERLETLTQQLIEEQERTARDREKQATISSHFTRGLEAYQQNDYILARGEWTAILAIDSTHAEATDYLDRTQIKINEILEGHRTRASQLESQGRYTEAISEWNNVQALDPGNASAARAIDRIRTKIEQQSQNLEQASRELEVVNLYDSALQQFNQGNYERSMSDLERLFRIDPDHKEAKNLYTQAKRKLTPLTQEEEETIRKLFLRGMQFFAKDQYANAIEEWEKILEIDPTNESVKRNIEEAKERLNQLEERQ